MAIMVVVFCLFTTLVGRLWYLQGIESKTQAAVSSQNEGIETVYIPAPRGDIFDRTGVLLAGNHIEQVVTVQRDDVTPEVVGELSALLHEPVGVINDAIDNAQYSPVQPVPVADGVSESVALAVAQNKSSMPGVSVQAEPVRYYPYGATLANIIGYVSEITSSQYKATDKELCAKDIPCYQADSQVGQAGVEETFEKYLRGTPGSEEIEVDAQGQPLGVVPGSYRPPVPGDNLVLSISLTDQEAAVQALGNGVAYARTQTDTVSNEPFRASGASMVVEDPNNGQILALATYPDYNDSDFVGGISQKQWDYYNDPANNYPMIDRAISSVYAPGSTWKLITATASLDYGLRGPYEYYDDVGSFSVGGQTFEDNADSGYGEVDLPEAITVSSDSYFYSLGYEFWQIWANDKGHPEYLQKIASEYGLGDYSGVDLPDESPGLVPSQQVFTREHDQYPKDYPDSYFEPGQEVQEAIGEGQDEVTPLQLADAYGTFANGGKLYVPQVALAIEAPGTNNEATGKVVKTFGAQVKDQVQMPGSADRAAMLAGFEGVTTNVALGTGGLAFENFPLDKYLVGGKTGTAQVDSICYSAGDCAPGTVPWPQYKQDTSVFTSFAPAPDPKFVVDAFFEQAGYGASVAAPAVEEEYLTLFHLVKSGNDITGLTDYGATVKAPATAGTTTTTGADG